jgi:hypothetical protein
MAMQECLAEGIEFVALHHPRKANAENKKPSTLDDIHGSGNLTRGMGSVLGLWGKAGDELIEVLHLKQPAEPVGPLIVMHDHAAGRSSVMSVGVTPGKKGDREKAIIARYMNKGGPGIVLTMDELEDLGSRPTVKEALDNLVTRGLLSYEQGGGAVKSSWTMIPPLANT